MHKETALDIDRFDRAVRAFAAASSRRTVLGLSLGGMLGALTFGAEAKNKKRKKKKVKFNEFGCVNVGGFCKNAGQCCSGICEGKKGKKKCKAHDTGGCTPGTIPFACDGTEVSCTTSAGLPGSCGTTTGNAGYCFTNLSPDLCSTDAECKALYGSRAACVKCPTMGEGSEGVLCAVVDPDDL